MDMSWQAQNLFLLEITQGHNHVADIHEVEKLRSSNEMKKKAIDTQFSTRIILADSMEALSQGGMVAIPELSSQPLREMFRGGDKSMKMPHPSPHGLTLTFLRKKMESMKN